MPRCLPDAECCLRRSYDGIDAATPRKGKGIRPFPRNQDFSRTLVKHNKRSNRIQIML